MEETARRLVARVAILLVIGAAALSWAQSPATDPHRLIEAAKGGHGALLQSLLEAGHSPNVMDPSGRTPLHWAATHGHRQAAQTLLEHGALLNAQDSSGRTALSYAVANGHSGMVAYLRGLGARGEPPTPQPTQEGVRGLKPSLKFRSVESFEMAIGEPAVCLDSKDVCFFAPERKGREAQVVLGYLVKAYNELYGIVGVRPEYKIAVYAFPKGHPGGWGGTSTCSIEYDDSNLDFEKHPEWIQYKIPHVSGYIEEMAHNFVHATKAQFGWEMIGWSLGAIVSDKVVGNPILSDQIRRTRERQKQTYSRYIRNDFVFPSDISANLCDRIHAWILWQCAEAYGPDFWKDFFRAIRKESQALKDAVRLGDGDAIRNARYKITVNCFDRLSGQLAFKERLRKAGISTDVDVKSLHPEASGWNRRLTD